MFKIETNIPVPAFKSERRGRPSKYPFGDMKVGDSFLAPNVNSKEAERIRSAAFSFGRRKGMDFASRLEGNGMRIWRVE